MNTIVASAWRSDIIQHQSERRTGHLRSSTSEKTINY